MRHHPYLPLLGLSALLIACQGSEPSIRLGSSKAPGSRKALPKEPIVFIGVIGGIT